MRSMETYRLKSKLVENNKEYVIQTANDGRLSLVSSEVLVDGRTAETVRSPYPVEIDSNEVLSLVKTRHGRMKKEIETLLAAYRRVMSGGSAQKMHQLGTGFFYKRFYYEARELFQSAVKLDPHYYSAFNYLSMTELALGNAEDAVRAAAIAVEKCPTYADYRNNLGEALLAGGSCKRAFIEFEEATRINLYYCDAYFNLGLTLVQNALNREDTGLFEDVLSRSAGFFRKAALIYPEYESDAYRQGLDLLRDSHLDQALQLLKAVREAKKESHRREFVTFHMRLFTYPECVSQEAIAERIEFLQSEIDRNPTYVDLQVELGHCYLDHAGLLWNKGIQQYQQALKMNPAVPGLSETLDEVERQYHDMCLVLSRQADKS